MSHRPKSLKIYADYMWAWVEMVAVVNSRAPLEPFNEKGAQLTTRLRDLLPDVGIIYEPILFEHTRAGKKHD